MIKTYLTKLAEKITGRKCIRCQHSNAGRCCHPDGDMFDKCWQSLTRPGFEYSESMHYARTVGAATTEGIRAGMEVKPAPLTPEQKLQLERIKAVLQEAEDTARESGLVSEN